MLKNTNRLGIDSMNKSKISASIVLYNTSSEMLDRLLNSIRLANVIDIVYVVDNSPASSGAFNFNGLSIEYIWTQKNCGYGSGHNIALRKAIHMGMDFHFVLNPDIYFDQYELQKMILRIQGGEEVGLLMPKVIYPDGSLQYLCKLLPTPWNLISRRFLVGPFKKISKNSSNKFELRFTGYKEEMNIPFLSGCFMLIRIKALAEIGLFDELFFMYGEDIDLSRRMHVKYQTIYFPGAVVVHDHARESYKNTKMLWIHAVNLIKYFNKWGWFIDSGRRKINERVIKDLTNA